MYDFESFAKIKEIIFQVNNCSKIGEELERMHPKLYTSVTRQISRKAGGELSSPESASVLLSSVARDLFRNDITWGKVTEKLNESSNSRSLNTTFTIS